MAHFFAEYKVLEENEISSLLLIPVNLSHGVETWPKYPQHKNYLAYNSAYSSKKFAFNIYIEDSVNNNNSSNSVRKHVIIHSLT